MEEHIPYEEYQQILKELNEKLSGNIYFQNRKAKLPFESFGASMAGEQMYIFFVYAHFLSDSLLLKAIKAYGDLLEGNESSMKMYLLPDMEIIYENFKVHKYNIGESSLSVSEREDIKNYKENNKDDIVFFLPLGMSLMPEDPLFMFVDELKEHNRSRIQEYRRRKIAEDERIRLQVEEEAKKAEASGQKSDKFLKYNLMKQYGVNKNNIVIAMRNAGESLEFINEWKSTTEPPAETGWLKDGGKSFSKKSQKLKKKSKNKSKQKKDGRYKKSLKKKRKSPKKH
jgi:hypothetical protein